MLRSFVLVFAAATAAGSHAALADCADDIASVMALTTSSGPYRMETFVAARSGPVTMTGEVVPPATMRTRTVIAGTTQEMVFIDGRGWMNVAGSWSELPSDLAGQMSQSVASTGDEIYSSISAPQCLGRQQFDGQDYLAYSFDYTIAGLTTSTRLYADPVTRRPMRLESASLNDRHGRGQTSVTYTYDPSISIAPPM